MLINKPTIYLSIEIKSREFIPKCFLAYNLIKKGFRVYIGSSLSVNLALRRSEPAILFHKSTWIKNSKFLKKLGHKFIMMDEEGGITTPRSLIKEYCAKRYKSISKNNTDLIFFPNNKFYNNVKKLHNSKGIKLVKTGWPRVDLWNPTYEYLYKDKISQIIKDYGNFYLFLSSFGMTGIRSYKSRLKNLKLVVKKKRFRISFKMLNNNIFLLKKLSALMKKNEKIILRPHPNESIHEWNKIFLNYKNILIVRDDDVTPWIYAAKSLIQAGSTTTTQAALLGKKSIIYNIIKEKGMTDTPSYELCENVKTPEEVYKLLQINKSKNNKKLSHFTKNFLKKEMLYDEDNPSANKIVNELVKLKQANIKEYEPNLKDKIKTNIDDIKRIFNDILLKLISLFPENYFIPKKYLISDKLKGGLKNKEIKKLINLFIFKDKKKIKFKCTQEIKNLVKIEKI